MSLLEEILSGIKRESPSGDVPPNLKRIVSSSMAKQRIRRRVVLIALFALMMVGVGFAAIFLFETMPQHVLRSSDDSKKVLQALQGLKTDVLRTQSVQPAATIDFPQSPPLPLNNSVEKPTPAQKRIAASPAVPDEHTLSPPFVPRGDASKTASEPEIGKSAEARDVRLRNAKHDHVSSKRREVTYSQQKRETTEVDTNSVSKTEKDLHLYAARSLESAGDFGRALDEYKKALEWDRENYVVLNNAAGVLIRLGLNPEAGAYAEKALTVKKDYVPALVNLAVARLKSGEAEEGMKYLSRAVQLAPNDKSGLSNLALLYERAGEYSKAYDLYRRLAAMDDIDGQLGMARVCERENRAKEAESIYRNILKRDTDKRAKKVASERLAALGSASNGAR